MNIDLIDLLAITLYRNKGAYALLLGSGVSRASGIPTGWEITQDLVGKAYPAAPKNDYQATDDWYKATFGSSADYSKIVETLAPTATRRRNLLKPYFEPSGDDPTGLLKRPTRAHRAIAKLVKKGYVRVVLTTNFDSLVELAMEDEGIRPVVASTPSTIAALDALAHIDSAVIKVNGDYREDSIRNTEEELRKYPGKVNSFLKTLFNDFGLIVCGWSATYDPGLTAAVKNVRDRRYGLFWTARTELSPDAKHLVAMRKASLIAIDSADGFFSELEHALEILEKNDGASRLSDEVAVIRTKQLVALPGQLVNLADLLNPEIDRVRFRPFDRPVYNGTDDDAATLRKMIEAYEHGSQRLCRVLANLAYWSKPEHDELLISAVERLAAIETIVVDDKYTRLRRYPALAAVYIIGIICCFRRRFEVIRRLLETKITFKSRRVCLVEGLNPRRIISHGDQWLLGQDSGVHAFTSNRLFEYLKVATLRDLIPDQVTYAHIFDWFEYILCLYYADICEQRGDETKYIPRIRCFGNAPEVSARIIPDPGRPAPEEYWWLVGTELFPGNQNDRITKLSLEVNTAQFLHSDRDR